MGEAAGFSETLKSLLEASGVQQQALADALAYDVSSVSKWTGGRALPSPKNAPELIERASRAIAETAGTDRRDALAEVLAEHAADEVPNTAAGESGADGGDGDGGTSLLAERITGALQRAYDTDRARQDAALAAPSVLASASATDLALLASPLLGGTSSGLIDLFSLDHAPRLVLAGIKEDGFRFDGRVEGASLSLGIDLSRAGRDDVVYDALYLIHLLASLSSIGLRLYNTPSAAGTLVLATEDVGALTAILTEGGAISVCEHRSPGDVERIASAIAGELSRERLVAEQTTMERLIESHDYSRLLISTGTRWLLGHVTEHLVGDALFEKLADGAGPLAGRDDAGELHLLARSALERDGACVMLYESALTSLTATGELDFFNETVVLEPAERVELLDDIARLAQPGGAELKIVREGFEGDFRTLSNPCVIACDTACSLRLENGRREDNLMRVVDRGALRLLERFFTDVWTGRGDIVTSGGAARECVIRHRDTAAVLAGAARS